MNYKIVERDSFNIMGVKKTITCDENFSQAQAINRFWREAGQDGTIEKLAGRMNGEISGLIGATVDDSKGNNEIEYWIGVEVSGAPSDEFESYEVPAAKWAVFEAVGPVMVAVPDTWRKVYSEWFPSHDYEQGCGPSLEVYKSHDTTSPTAKTEIWVPLK